MYLLFIDEFGHENTQADGQAPVFGYGGFIIPAEHFSNFSTEFFDIKVAAFKPLYKARLRTHHHKTDHELRSRERIKAILDRLNSQDPRDYFRDLDLRRAVARYEVKGSDVFSASYLTKLARRAKDRGSPGVLGSEGRTMVRFAKWLVNSLQYYGGEVFYVGFHRSQIPILKRHERIHVALVSQVIDRAHQFAVAQNAVVKIIFDHHYSDIGPTVGPGGVQYRGFVSKSRSDRAREIVLSKDYFGHLTEPIFNAKSHFSQGVQAADWICALLRILLIHRSEQDSGYGAFATRLDQPLFSLAAEQSIFRMCPTPLCGPLYERQEQLELRGGSGISANPQRPYRR